MTLEVQEALNQARGDVAAAVQEAAEIISTAEEDAGSLAIS
jgi:vacuolar-type H+-ATPase subunit H